MGVDLDNPFTVSISLIEAEIYEYLASGLLKSEGTIVSTRYIT